MLFWCDTALILFLKILFTFFNSAVSHQILYSPFSPQGLLFSHFFPEFYVISLDFFELVFHFIPPSLIMITVIYSFFYLLTKVNSLNLSKSPF